MDWVRLLPFVTGMVDQELLARNEYLAAENRILKARLKGRLKLSDAERATLGEIGHRLGRKILSEVASVAQPDTILAWYRKLVARKFDGSKARRSPGRPRIKREVEQLIVRMAKENRDWGYDRIAGALANLGYEVCDQTVGNVLQRHGLPPAPERKRTTTWSAFIRIHLALLAGTDFFTAEVLTLHGLVTYYVLFFIHLESRRVDIAGVTVHPDERWMRQIARNMTMEGYGALRDCRYLLHDRDTKYTQSFRAIIASGGVEPLVLPARSPNLNAYAERWVRSVKVCHRPSADPPWMKLGAVRSILSPPSAKRSTSLWCGRARVKVGPGVPRSPPLEPRSGNALGARFREVSTLTALLRRRNNASNAPAYCRP
jgi:putative transposase